jgi:hypothetical protein
MSAKAEITHVDLLFPSKYLKAADLRGKRVPVVIEHLDPRAELKMRGGKTERKPVVTLKGKDKQWCLNKTNAMSVAEVYGPELRNWIGKTVVLYGTRVQFGSKEVEAVRVDVAETQRRAKVKAAPVEREPDHDPETGEVIDDFDSIGPPPVDQELFDDAMEREPAGT